MCKSVSRAAIVHVVLRDLPALLYTIEQTPGSKSIYRRLLANPKDMFIKAVISAMATKGWHVPLDVSGSLSC